MTHSPADVLAKLLVDLGETWAVKAYTEPNDPDDCITVKDAAPRSDGFRTRDGRRLAHDAFQVAVRSSQPELAFRKAYELDVQLNESIANRLVHLEGSTYTVESVASDGPINAGRTVPSSKRSLFTINGLIVVYQRS